MKKFVLGLALAKLILLTVFAALVFSSCQTAQLSPIDTAPTVTPTATPATINDNINRPTSQPYKGDLSIFEDANRAKNLQIDRVMNILKITDGKTVADIGAGSGWFTVRAAKRVGEKGKVFAVEINEDAIKYINDRAEKENFMNIQTVPGTEDDPKLADNSIDACLILKSYHEIGQPIKVLKNLKKSLRRDALVGVIDRNGNGDDHGINKDVVIDEFKRAGFKLSDQYDFVKPDGEDYFLIFKAE
ncbi:MAG: methyltransferase domain-containing protein [Pyrinomonadaceae bacterium]